MDIVSYRGPLSPGGVSNAVQTGFYDPRVEIDGWWFISGNRFKHLSRSPKSSFSRSVLSPDLVRAHNAYCNLFLWPLFHGFFDTGEYDAKWRLAYRRVNRLMAETVMSCQLNPSLFVHDYQLAMTPKFLHAGGSREMSFFWHIPWSASIPEKFNDVVTEIARSLSHASKIGFQTRTDADNFLEFCDRISLTEYASLQYKVHVAPVPIDHELWNLLSLDEQHRRKTLQEFAITETEKIVLSVERADYTKGVTERLEAIRFFLQENPDLLGKIRFIEVIPRTWQDIPVYDHYWQQCAATADDLNRTFGRQGWQPVAWIEEPLSSPQLAVLYERADVLLITSLADGLNLTAKEFLMCQQENPGALVLSENCGVASEIGQTAFLIDPSSSRVVAQTLLRALQASSAEKARRVAEARTIIEDNDALQWVSRMKPPTFTRQLNLAT